MKKNAQLTRRQNDALVFIKGFIAERTYPPSIRDIAVGMDLSSSSTVFSLLQQLEEKGFIKHVPGHPRPITIIEQAVPSAKDKLIHAQVGHIDTVNAEMIRLQSENEQLKMDQELSIYYLKEFRSRISKDSGIYNELNKRIIKSEKLAKAVKK